jgi:hypothetical protein
MRGLHTLVLGVALSGAALADEERFIDIDTAPLERHSYWDGGNMAFGIRVGEELVEGSARPIRPNTVRVTLPADREGIELLALIGRDCTFREVGFALPLESKQINSTIDIEQVVKDTILKSIAIRGVPKKRDFLALFHYSEGSIPDSFLLLLNDTHPTQAGIQYVGTGDLLVAVLLDGKIAALRVIPEAEPPTPYWTEWAKLEQPKNDDTLAKEVLRRLERHEKWSNWKPNRQQDGADQPATAVESKAEGKEKPKPESEGRSQ